MQLLGVFAEAAEPVRLAYSDKLGVAIFAYPDAGGEWCRAKLGISILIKDGSPLLSQGVDDQLPKFGALFAEKCPAASSATIGLYKASDHSLIGKSFSVAKADNWSRPADSQAIPSATPAPAATAAPPASVEAPPEPVACDHSPVAADYFAAACYTRGLEFHHQAEGLEVARTRQLEAATPLHCTPQSMTRVNDMAVQASLRILNSGVISPLMDFADGLQVECKKAGPELLK